MSEQQITDGAQISSLLNRSQAFAGQAPELFVLGKYYEAKLALLPEKILQINDSTEPAIMAGMDIAMIPGHEFSRQVEAARRCSLSVSAGMRR